LGGGGRALGEPREINLETIVMKHSSIPVSGRNSLIGGEGGRESTWYTQGKQRRDNCGEAQQHTCEWLPPYQRMPLEGGKGEK
jgi:hypothetical protein